MSRPLTATSPSIAEPGVRRLRIVLYSWAFAPSTGGLEDLTTDLARYLAGQGHRVTVVTHTPAAAEDSTFLPFDVVRRPSPVRLGCLIAEADIVQLNSFHALSFVLAMLIRRPMIWQHVFFDTVCPRGICNAYGTSCQFSVRRCYPCLRRDRSRLEAVRAILRMRIRRGAAHLVSANIVPSRYLTNQTPLPRSTLVPFGVDVNFWAPPERDPPAPGNLLLVARLIAAKGADVVIRAVARCHQAGVPLTVRIVGDGPERRRLEAMSRELGVAEAITFLGFQDEEGLRREMLRASIVIMATTQPEVGQLTTLKALSCGCAVVASEIGDLPEQITPAAGIFFAPGDDGALAAALTTLALSPDLLRRLQIEARGRATAHFDATRMRARYLGVYRDLLGKRFPGTARAGRPRVAVVIKTYARPDALGRALVSLQDQVEPAEEVIVAAWAEDAATIEAAGRVPGVRVLRVAENTLTAKHNASIAATTADVIAFMDDDAVAPPRWLRRLRDYYDDPTVGGVGGRDVLRGPGSDDTRVAKRIGAVRWFGRLAANHHQASQGVREVDFLKACNMSFRRSVIPLVDPRLIGAIPYGFEIDVGLTVRETGARIIYDPELTVDHYSPTDMSATIPALTRIVNHNNTYVLLKHLGWPRRLAFLAYTIAIGDRDTIGLARIPVLLTRSGWPLALILAHLRAKLRGIGSFLVWWTWDQRRGTGPAGKEPAQHLQALGGDVTSQHPQGQEQGTSGGPHPYWRSPSGAHQEGQPGRSSGEQRTREEVDGEGLLAAPPGDQGSHTDQDQAMAEAGQGGAGRP